MRLFRSARRLVDKFCRLDLAVEDLRLRLQPALFIGAQSVSRLAIRSPGMLAKHYAPDCPLRLNARAVRPGEALLAFGPDAPAADIVLNLSERGDPVEAAANLFRHLHALNARHPAGIAVMPIPEAGLGRAINDRLRRAAA